MKHPSNREFFAYWDAKRGEARAPDRSDIEPAAVRELLGDIFVLSSDTASGFPFRVAGTRVCALLGRDLKDTSFTGLFDTESCHEIEDVLTAVTEEMLPAVGGITARSKNGARTQMELLLLPFSARAHTPMSLTGLLAPFESPEPPLGTFSLTSWRYLYQPQKLLPRTLRKLQLARGLMVYEGWK